MSHEPGGVVASERRVRPGSVGGELFALGTGSCGCSRAAGQKKCRAFRAGGPLF